MPIQRRSLNADEAPTEETSRGPDEQSGYRRIPSAPRAFTQIGVAPPHRTVTQPMMPAVVAPRAAPSPRAVFEPVLAPARPAIRRVDTPPRLEATPPPRTTTQRMHVPTVHATDAPAERGRHGTLKMEAVRADAPPSSGRMLDELDFYDGDPAVALELGAMPAGHVARDTMAGPPPSVVHFRQRSGKTPVPPEATPAHRPPVAPASVTTSPAIDPRPGIVAFAGFGFVPESVLHTPAYSLRVLMRSRILRNELARTRGRRPQDVWLYEAALRCADPASFAKGIVLLCVWIGGLVAAILSGAVFLLW